MERALLVALGVVLGGVAALGIYAWQLHGTESPDAPATSFPAVEHDSAVVPGFIDDWARWRLATFVSEGTWSRSVDGIDEPLTGPLYTVQDPPRRLVVRLGTTVEQVDDRIASCDSSDEEIIAPVCLAGTGLSYSERVDAEMRLVLGYVRAETRIYNLRQGDDGCYQLELTAPVLASPWGKWAEFCFDEASGALRRAVVRRQSATDVELTVLIRTDVTPDDFG